MVAQARTAAALSEDAASAAAATRASLDLPLAREHVRSPVSSPMKHKRQPSYVKVNVNQNTAWLSSRGIYMSYLLFVGLTWLGMTALLSDPSRAWLYVAAVHFGVTFYLFHWHKGSPIVQDHGDYDDLTFWEQMDAGVHHTATKKFFTTMPVVVYLFVLQVPDARSLTNPTGVANATMAMLLVVAKLPAMHKVRLFGINGAPAAIREVL